jgi:hypothetical protein
MGPCSGKLIAKTIRFASGDQIGDSTRTCASEAADRHMASQTALYMDTYYRKTAARWLRTSYASVGSLGREPAQRRWCTVGNPGDSDRPFRCDRDQNSAWKPITHRLHSTERSRGHGPRSVGCWMLYVIYDQEFHRPLGRFELQPELFLHGDEHGRPRRIGVRRARPLLDEM